VLRLVTNKENQGILFGYSNVSRGLV
jgi:hypothetical protein